MLICLGFVAAVAAIIVFLHRYRDRCRLPVARPWPSRIGQRVAA